MTQNVYLYLIVAALTLYAVRALPMTLIRKDIKSPFIRSFLYYVPYVTLAVMTFPAMVEATQAPLAGLLALLVGATLAFLGAGLFPVSIACCLTVFLAELVLL